MRKKGRQPRRLLSLEERSEISRRNLLKARESITSSWQEKKPEPVKTVLHRQTRVRLERVRNPRSR